MMTRTAIAMNPPPTTIEAWFDEIARGYNEALETIPFGPLAGTAITPADLFHLAPAISLKFRNLKQSKRLLKKATDAALSTYVANQDEDGTFPGGSIIAFALCYLASHYGLGIVTEERVAEVMDAIVTDGGTLVRKIEDGELFGVKTRRS